MQQTAASTGHNGPNHIRTLIVEPETEARQLLELALSVRGQTVVACSDAASARDALRDTTFRIIIVSRSLPDSDGLQFVREVRGSETESARAFVIMISGHSTPEDQTKLLGEGVDDYIAWPAGTDILRERFDNAEFQAHSRDAAQTPRHLPASELFLVLHADATIARAGASAEQLLGYPADAIAGASGFSFFDPADAHHVLAMVTEAYSASGASSPREVRVRRDIDVWRTVTIHAVDATGDPTIGGLALYMTAPTAHARTAASGVQASLHDSITELPNRALFIDRIEHAVARAARKNLPVVVVTVDFNEFDGIDVVSDDLIVALSERLRSCLRTSDTAARLGRDEFGLLLEEIVDQDNIRIVADRIVESMQVPFYNAGEELLLTPNIGIIVSSTERYRAIDLLRDSTTARSWARIQGSGQYVMFDESMSTKAQVSDESATPSSDPAVASDEPVETTPSIVAAVPASPEAVDTRFDALQERLDVLERLIRELR